MRKKQQLGKRIIDIETQGKKNLEQIKKIELEAKDISCEIKQMDNQDLDEDDISAIQNMKDGYEKDFKEAHSQESKEAREQLCEGADHVEKEVAEGIQGVADVRKRAEHIEHISDVGRENAQMEMERMDQSAKEYREFVEEALKMKKQMEEALRRGEEELQKIFD